MSTTAHDLACVLLVAGAQEPGARRRWFTATELRNMLTYRLGIDTTAQQVAVWLTRMVAEDLPRFERRSQWGGPYEYTVTPYAYTQLGNALPAFRALRR